MYKLNEASNESKDYINLYKMVPSLKLNHPKKEKRNSFDLTNLSKHSLNSRKKSILSENSNNTNNINKIQKIKDYISNKDISYDNCKNSISFKSINFPICLSFMTNSKNYINSINKKFRVRNFHDFTDYKTVSDNNINNNNSSLINNNSNLEKRKEIKNILNLKLNTNKKSKEIKEIMSKINFSMNNQYKKKINNKIFLENENSSSNSAVNIKNYNYFIGTIDKSINFFDQKKIFKKKENLKRIQKIKNTKFNELPKPKKNYMDLFMNTSNLKLNLPKTKLLNILTKKINSNLNTSADIDFINKETSINDSKKSLKPKSSSKILIPKKEINNNKSEKKIKEKNIEKIPEKKSEKTGIGGFPQLEKKIEKKENKESNINNKISKNFSTKVSFAKLDEKKEQNENEVKVRKKKLSNRKSSTFEKVLQKRILYLHKKSKIKNKMKFFDLVINKGKQNIDEESNNFLNDISLENNSSIKLKPSKILKESKYQAILSRKKYVERIISNQSEKLNFNTYNYFSKFTDLLTIKKSLMSSNTKILTCRFKYLTFTKNSILHICLYSYISMINKCGLDINLKNYIYSNLDFSSISLPQVDQDNSLKQSLILGGIKRKKKENKEIFSTVKTKFIESKKYKFNKMAQTASLNFIKKELDFYNVLKTVNFLENDHEKNNVLQRNKICINNSPVSKTSILRRKKSKNYMTKRVKYIGRNNSTQNISRVPNSLSILEDKKFFSKEKGHLLKKFRNSVSGNLIFYKIVSQNNFKRILTKGSADKDISDLSLQKEYKYMSKVLSLIKARKLNKDLSYNKYDLLKQIKDKENIESILRLFIIEGESMLFVEYFNDLLKRIDINSKDGEGNTFLILSIKAGMNYVSKLLLEKGANPNIQNYEGNSALHFALSRKNYGMADLLKLYGAKEDSINKRGFNPWECLGKSIENAN